MLFKTSTVLALLGVAAQVAVAAPPACLIAAISTQSDPSDIKSICNSPSDVQKYIGSKCGNYQQQAMNAFASTCSTAGVTVSTSLPASSSVSPSSSQGPTGTTSTQGSSAASSSVSTTAGTSSTNIPSSGSSGSSPSGTQTPTTTLATTVVSATSPTRSATGTSAADARLSVGYLGLTAFGALGAMLAL